MYQKQSYLNFQLLFVCYVFFGISTFYFILTPTVKKKKKKKKDKKERKTESLHWI